MTIEEIRKMESELEKRGYKKIETCLYGEEDYDWYLAFRGVPRDDEDRGLRYHIFYRFWNFEKYRSGAGYSISVSIMPDSIIDDVGRRDLELSTDYVKDASQIDKVERIAEKFYQFITETDKW